MAQISHLLLEDGCYLLLETGFKILLEDSFVNTGDLERVTFRSTSLTADFNSKHNQSSMSTY